jgi:cobalamin biosynthesis protein CobT
MAERIHVMREAIVKITQILAGKKISVTQVGTQAYVQSDSKGQPIRVNLPYIPDNATQELLDALQGYLDHEVAHIMFTDFNDMPKAQSMGIGGMYNVMEDTRIERLMAERFEGSAENLSGTGRFLLENYTIPELKKAKAAGDQEKVEALLTMPVIRGMAGQQVFKDFVDQHMADIQDVYDKLKPLEPLIAGARSSADALSVAEKASAALRGATPAPSSGMSSMTKPGAGGGGGGLTSGGGPSEGEEDEGFKPGLTDDSAKEEKKPGEEEDEGEEEDPAAGGEGEEEEDPSDDREEATITSHINGSTSGSLSAIEKELANTYDEKLSQLVTSGVIDASKAAPYLVWTTDHDVVEPLKVGSEYKPTMLQSMQDEVDHMVGPMQKDLERAISARSLKRWSPGQRSGRVNPAALHRLSTGDDRVFRQRQEVLTKDVAVELVIDMSGSMSGGKIHTAAKAAYALASTLDRIGITSEVICFTTGGHSYLKSEDVLKEEEMLGRGFTRVEPLYMPILKGFDERMSTGVKQRFAWLPNCSSLANNVDGESVELAGMRLLRRKEKGKIMIVLSDGHPACYTSDYDGLNLHLKKVVERMSMSGVNMIGIGIKDDSVREFYPKAMVIHDVKELPPLIMRELRLLLAK